MTPAGAQHAVLASLFAAGGIDAINAIADGALPSMRQTLGLTVAGVILTAMAPTAPNVAAGFAFLVLLTSLFHSGLHALATFRKALA